METKIVHKSNTWTYSNYRAALYKNGEIFALVTCDGSNALPPKKAEELITLLTAAEVHIAGMAQLHAAIFSDNTEPKLFYNVGEVVETIPATPPTRECPSCHQLKSVFSYYTIKNNRINSASSACAECSITAPIGG